MLKEFCGQNKKIFISGIIIASTCFTQMPSSAFASTNTVNKHNIVAVKSGLKFGNINTVAEQDFLNKTNALRASLGIGPLKINSELLSKARNWSQTQADAGTIFHSTLTDGVTQNWQSLGENVGMGPDVLSIHNALVASPRHYQNLVDSRFTDIGIGVISQNGTIYVSQVFMQFMPVQASPPPAPTPPTTTLTAANSTGKKSVGSAQSITPPASQTTAPLATPPVAEAASFKTASQELVDVVAKLHDLEQ